MHIPTFPAEVGLPEYHDERYDPLWAEISDADLAISQHLGLVASLWELFRRDPTPQKAIFTSQPCLRLAETIGFWILPGVLARFPKLKVVLVEPSLGWVPFYLDLLDSMAAGPYDFPALDDKPSTYFHRQMYLTFVDDPRRPRNPSRPRRRADHVVDRFPAPGDVLAELAGSRREELRGHPRGRTQPDRRRERGRALRTLIVGVRLLCVGQAAQEDADCLLRSTAGAIDRYRGGQLHAGGEPAQRVEHSFGVGAGARRSRLLLAASGEPMLRPSPRSA